MVTPDLLRHYAHFSQLEDDALERLASVAEERVFPTAPEVSAGMTRVFNKAVKRANIPRCTFHDLRKTGATQLLRAGVPLQVVQAMGGWKRPDVLLRHYTTASLQDKQKAADVLAGLAAALK